jgi:lipopolysaccharide transport system permease protein
MSGVEVVTDAGIPGAGLMRIKPSRGWVSLRLDELWQYRELLYFLTWRDIKVRYKQTILGVLWAVAQPVGMMVVFTIFLGRLAHVPSDGVPYPIFVLSALLLWQLFSAGLNESANSLVANERLITKVYFPRVIVPASAILSALVDFAIGFAIFLIVLPFWMGMPSGTLLFAPVFVIAAIIAAFGAGLWLSALNVQYRDVRYVLGFLSQLWLFATPVVYPASIVPAKWRAIYALNPMTGIIEGFRWSIVGGPQPSAVVLLSSVSATFVLLISGLYYFNRMEDSFADVI